MHVLRGLCRSGVAWQVPELRRRAGAAAASPVAQARAIPRVRRARLQAGGLRQSGLKADALSRAVLLMIVVLAACAMPDFSSIGRAPPPDESTLPALRQTIAGIN